MFGLQSKKHSPVGSAAMIQRSTLASSLQSVYTMATKSFAWSFAFGSLFIFSQSYALSLQNIEVSSHLGEPLDAIVRVTAAPGEILNASCISATSANGSMPSIHGIQLSLSRSVSPGTIRLRTRQPIREPMSELVLQVNCPNVPHVKRNFLVMVDPVQIASQAKAQTASAATRPRVLNSTRQTPNRTFTSNNSRIRVAGSTSIANPTADSSNSFLVNPGTNYRVETGDTLSTIASRVEGRQRGTVWSWAATIQSANPHAFINGNPNEIIAGSNLFVPAVIAPSTAGLTVAHSLSANANPQAASRGNNNSESYAHKIDASSTAANASSSYAQRQNLSRNSADSSTRASSGELKAVQENQTIGNANTTGLSDAQIATLGVTDKAPSDPVPNTRTAIGAIATSQPLMKLSSTYSNVSLERINQRKAGLIQVLPDNLPTFTQPQDKQQPVSAAEQPSPVAPNDTKPELAATTSTSDWRFSWISILGLLGLLGLSFFGGMMLSAWRARKVVNDEVAARLDEARYRERMLSGRRNMTEEVMKRNGTGIVVTETDVALDTLAGEEPKTAPVEREVSQPTYMDDIDESLEFNTAQEFNDNSVVIPALPKISVDIDDTHAISNIDLELLEKDYAAQTEQNLQDKLDSEDSDSTGTFFESGTQLTDIMESSLDMEFPEEDPTEEDSTSRFETLDFDASDELFGSDIDNTGAVPINPFGDDSAAFNADQSDSTSATTAFELDELDSGDLGIDLEQAGADIDAQLKELEAAEIAASMVEVSTPTEAVRKMNEEDKPLPPTSTRDSEEFYHLEASSIIDVGELSFEQDADDETNILKFRQRNMKTGTDGADDS